MTTVPIVDSLGNDEGMKMNMNLRESSEVTTSFDTKKWKRMINGNVDMIKKKVD